MNTARYLVHTLCNCMYVQNTVFFGMLIKVSLKATGAPGAKVFDETNIARTFREGVNRKSSELFIIKIKLYLIEGGGGVRSRLLGMYIREC